ncbi:hypothetical protein C8J57DRAFT_1529041 [Mycena rebaudengoi]|nr:hypothetical protein C8J57DRAFT_1529041 [Mycena rebaudengoi]
MASPLDFDATSTYVDLIRLLKPQLRWLQASYHSAPSESLLVDIHDFLLSLEITDDIGKLAWQQLRETAWAHDLTPMEELAARTKHVKLFLDHGLSHHSSVYSLEPPIRVCMESGCGHSLPVDASVIRHRELVEPKTF